jgi:predicted nucleotidyltransferase
MMAINEGMVQDAVNRVLRAAPGSRVIVFGSWARGDASPDSDLDILVVEPEVKNRYGEMVRLARLLGEQLVPADVIVISQSSFDRWRDVPNSLAWRAAREGRLYERVV